MRRFIVLVLILGFACCSLGAEHAELWAAAERGDLGGVRSLIRSASVGASIQAKNEHGWDALMFAVYGGHVETVRLLLELGANPNTKERDSGNRCLNSSCTSGQLLGGKTVLIYAAERGHSDIVRILLAGGADPNGTDKRGFRALNAAWKADIVQLLLAAGTDPNYVPVCRELSCATGINTPLVNAAQGAGLEVLRLLLERGADPNLRGADERTALQAAAHFGFDGYEGAVKILVDAGAEIDACNWLGETALMIAARQGYVKFVKALLVAGADPSIRDKRGQTALRQAIAARRDEIVEMLEAAERDAQHSTKCQPRR